MPRSFFSIDFFDPDTRIVVHEIYLENFDADDIPEFIRQKMLRLPGNRSETLDRNRLAEWALVRAELSKWSNLPIRLRHALSELPSRVHGGCELDLMMKGQKPLSVFSHVNPSSDLGRFLVTYFEPLVERGKLVSRKVHEGEASDPTTATTYFYALPEEAWRIEAHLLMTCVARVTGWNDALENTEGLLLGYTPEQNRLWNEYRREKGYRWGLFAMYRFVDKAEVALIRKSGGKAFMTDDASPIQVYLPHFNLDQYDPQAALAGLRPGRLARFYIPLLCVSDFSRGMIRSANVDFEVFELPASSLAKLNEAIDGTIDLI